MNVQDLRIAGTAEFKTPALKQLEDFLAGFEAGKYKWFRLRRKVGGALTDLFGTSRKEYFADMLKTHKVETPPDMLGADK